MPEAPRRIVLVINDLARAGAETQVVHLATGLDRRRFQPTIVLLKQRNDFVDELARAEVPVFALQRQGPWDLGLQARLSARLRAERAHLVHSFLFLSNLWMALVARRAGVPRLLLSQRCSYELQLSPALRRLARWSHGRADRLVVNSQAIGAEETAAGFPLDRLVVIPNGTPLPELSASSVDRREALGLPGAGPFVLSLGQLTPEKGHRVLVEAWSAVHARHPDALLGLVGEGPERPALEARARELGLGASVRFFGFRSPVAPFLAAADVVVQPSFSEGMPNAVLEAMAHARAVVVTAVGGVPELVGDAARLVPPADPGALAAALTALLADPMARAELGRRGRLRAERNFSLQAMVRANEALYEDLISKTATNAPAGSPVK